MTMPRIQRLGLITALVAIFVLPALSVASSTALAGPLFAFRSVSNSSVAPGNNLDYEVIFQNVGDADSDGSEVTLEGTFPADISPIDAYDGNPFVGPEHRMNCGVSSQVVTCSGFPLVNPANGPSIRIETQIAPGATGIRTAHFTLAGGGFPEAKTADSVEISPVGAGFDISAFDGLLSDNSGAALSKAARHPAGFDTAIEFASHTDPRPVVGFGRPVEDVKTVSVKLPAGLVGRVSGVGQCTLGQLGHAASPTNIQPECPVDSQIGFAEVEARFGLPPVSIFNMVPPPGVPARFGFNEIGTITVLDTRLVSEAGEYRLEVTAPNIPQALALNGSILHFWGVPRDPVHDPRRSCPGMDYPSIAGPTCEASGDAIALFRTPTTCASPGVGLPVTAVADSWEHPGTFASRSFRTHETPWFPEPEEEGPEGGMHRVWGEEVGIEDCDQVPFEPSFSLDTTTDRADSPTGLSVNIDIPDDCWAPKPTVAEAEDAVCNADLKKAVVTLPEGFSLNSAAGTGREGCSPSQMGVSSPQGQLPVAFDEEPVSCPNSSKIGEVEIDSPLIDEKLKGFVYLAEQGKNPFGSLVAIYFVAEGAGVQIKQAGEISLDPSTGRITNTFDQAPQVPFSNLRLDFYGGPRATVRTPASCGTFSTNAAFSPWSGTAAVRRSSSVGITQGCGGGFDPKLQAGTENPFAGSYSPFNLQLTRTDGMEEFGSLRVSMPPGLVGSLAGYTYCPDAVLASISGAPDTGRGQEASPSCPASSHVGSATVGAGAGPNPFYTSAGRVYLAGPYKGAPLSLAVVTPAVAGPFDLGTTVVRNAIQIDPTTAQLTIESDPLPRILHGIPLDLRDIRIRYEKTVNPTSCEPMTIGSTIASTQGRSASPSVHFQAANCDHLGFKPRLSLQLSGKPHRAAHPRLRAVLRPRPGDANIGRANVLLPKTEILENAHIREVCTRVQYAANGGGGAGCPKGSVYGYARAWTPLLSKPLQGPVYLRSNGGDRELPDLVASLDGQIHVDLVGYIDSVRQRIRNRFAIVPDTPVSKFELTMQGGRKGLLANNTNICRARPHATVRFDGQNDRIEQRSLPVKPQCGKSGRVRKR